MSVKPSYEELEQKIKELEKEIIENKQSAESITKIENALLESEKKYRMIADNTNDLIWILDLDAIRISYASPSVKKITGYSVEEYLSMPMETLLTPDSLKITMEILSDALKQNENRKGNEDITQRVEWQIFHKNGYLIWVEAETNFLRDDQAKPIGVIGVSRDISERKKAEQSLREIEARYKSLFDSSLNILYVYDLQGNFIDANKAALEFIGYDFQEITSLNFQSLLGPDQIPEAIVIMEKIIKDGFDDKLRIYKVKTKKGDIRFIEARGVLLYKDNKPYAVQGIATDITERQKAENALQASEEKFRAMVEKSPIGIAIVNDNYQYVYVNDKFCSISGYQNEELLGKNFYFLLAEESREQAKERYIRRQKGEDVPGRYEFSLIRKGGEKRYGEGQSVTYLDNAGRVNSLVQIRDITDQKRAEEEKQKLQDQLIQAQKMESVGRLAGGVAHDFNNMLGVILGHTEMAMDQVDFTHPLHADLEEIQKAGQRSADLTRQLLAFARKQMVSPRVLNLNETIENMLKMIQRLIGENIQLNWLPGANLWPIKMDPSQIDQILTNLCINARDAIADVGEITIETGNSSLDAEYCARHAGFAPGDYVRLVVGDNGCGMDKETLANIFDPFFTTKEMGRGTGLGLSTVYGAIKQNNGFINAESEPGHGTKFTIYLPRNVVKDGQVLSGGAEEPIKLGKETILLVEDEPTILNMTAKMLERQGYKVLAANTPGEAIRLAEENAGEVHLLMTDVIMPEMSGRDLAKIMTSMYPQLKRLFMSGYTANVIAHSGMLDEGVNFIQKPFSIKTLAAKVREALDKK